MTMNRFRFVDPRRFARARDEHCERKLLLRARGTDHRQSYSTRLHCTYQLAWRQGITFVRLGLFKHTTPLALAFEDCPLCKINPVRSARTKAGSLI
jgi:hypothetical protein